MSRKVAARGREARTKPPATVTVSRARARLYGLLDEAASSHQPILITGKRANAVLLSEDDWTAIQETLYLLSVPGMRESVRKGMKAPVETCAKEPGWRAGKSSSPKKRKRTRKESRQRDCAGESRS